MAETIIPSQTLQPSSNVRESASPRGPETDAQPVAVSMGQQLPGIVRRAKLDIRLLAPAEILTLQRTMGNQAVLRLIASAREHYRNDEAPRQSSPPAEMPGSSQLQMDGTGIPLPPQLSVGGRVRGAIRPPQALQAKLTIGAPDDAYEKEADSVAEEVMSHSSTLLRQYAAPGATGSDEDSRNGASVQLNANGNSRVVQRDDPPASVNPPVGGSTPDYSKMTWQQLLPRAHGAKGAGITKIDLHTPGNKIDTWGTGAAPTLNYVPDKDIHTDPASAAPQGGVGGTPEADAQAAAENSALSAAQDAAVSQIITARAKIPDRPMGRSPNNNAGYDYNPDKDPAAKDYNQWVKSALPTGVQDSDWNWQVFKRIQGLEGQEGRFTTFDKTLSVGPGYSTSGGQTQQVIGKTFNLLPEVKSVAFDAGLTVDASGGMNVVDTDKKWILDSQDAAAYVQTEVSLLSLLVNVSQGAQPVDASGAVAPDEQGKQRQALLDAEWRQFLSGTLAGVTSLVQSWPLDSAVLAVHAKHAQPGNFPFTFWNGQNGPDLATMVAAIYAKVGASAKYICTGKYAQYQGSSKGSNG